MPINGFIQIDGIDGESKDSEHEKWISVFHYSFGISQSATPVECDTNGSTDGKSSFDSLTIKKRLDSSTPQIYEYCAKGKPITTVTLDLCRAGEEKTVYMSYTLTNAVISKVKTEVETIRVRDNDIEFPMQTVSFNFNEINWSYQRQDRAEGVDGGYEGSFNIQTGQ